MILDVRCPMSGVATTVFHIIDYIIANLRVPSTGTVVCLSLSTL